MTIVKEISLLIWQAYKKQPNKVTAHCLLWFVALGLCSLFMIIKLSALSIYMIIALTGILSLVFFSHVFLNPHSSLVDAATSIPVHNLKGRLCYLAATCFLAIGLAQILPPAEVSEAVTDASYWSRVVKIGVSGLIISASTVMAGSYCVAYLISSDMIIPDNKFLECYTIPLLILNLGGSSLIIMMLFLSGGLLIKATILLPSMFTTLLLGGAYAHYKGFKPQKAEEKAPNGELSLGF